MKLNLAFLTRRTAILTCLICAGAFAGAASRPAVMVADGCEHDECEGGKWCKDNPGGGTQCNMEGSNCKTKACDVE